MSFNDIYRRQVELLVRSIPHVAAVESFALKGGTAINLFVRDMPRLSVDIDLTYLPIADRTQWMSGIEPGSSRQFRHLPADACRNRELVLENAHIGHYHAQYGH